MLWMSITGRSAVWALKRKLLTHPGHEFRPGNQRGVVRAGLLIHVATASGAMTIVPVPAGRSVALLANIPDGQYRDGPPEHVVRGKDAVIPMPVLPVGARDRPGGPQAQAA